MAQSYLGADRFGAFDASFATGVQLGTQIVKERQERQQKLQDQQTQLANELAAEKNRQQLQIQANAAELAQKSQQAALDAKAAIEDPVLYRKNQWDARSAQLTAGYDAQDALNKKILDPNDPSYSQQDRANARAALAKTDTQRKLLIQATPQKYDPATPVQFPDTNPALAVDPNNVVTPQYTQTYRDSLVKEEKGGLTPGEQATQARWDLTHPKNPDGTLVDMGKVRGLRKGFATQMQNLSEYSALGNQAAANQDPDAWQANRTKAAGKVSAFGVLGPLTDQDFLSPYTNNQPGGTAIVQKYINDYVQKNGPIQTPDDILKFRTQAATDANALEPSANPNWGAGVRSNPAVKAAAYGAGVISSIFANPPADVPPEQEGDQ